MGNPLQALKGLAVRMLASTPFTLKPNTKDGHYEILAVKFEVPRRQLHIRTKFSVALDWGHPLRTPTYRSTLGFCNSFQVVHLIQLRPAYINPNKNRILNAVACSHLQQIVLRQVDQLFCMSPTALATPLNIRIRREMSKHVQSFTSAYCSLPQL